MLEAFLIFIACPILILACFVFVMDWLKTKKDASIVYRHKLFIGTSIVDVPEDLDLTGVKVGGTVIKDDVAYKVASIAIFYNKLYQSYERIISLDNR